MLHEQVRLYILNHDNISSFFLQRLHMIAHYLHPGGTDFSCALGDCCAGVRKITFVTRMIIRSNCIRLCMFCYFGNFQFILCIIGFLITSYMRDYWFVLFVWIFGSHPLYYLWHFRRSETQKPTLLRHRNGMNHTISTFHCDYTTQYVLQQHYNSTVMTNNKLSFQYSHRTLQHEYHRDNL